jgi:hypothetical protein
MNMALSIGNTDNKLTQAQWSDFVGELVEAIFFAGAKVHFFGGSATWSPWQNVAWILEVKNDDLQAEVTRIRKKYDQESAFVLSGHGEFV